VSVESLTPTGIIGGTCVRQRVSVESQSAVFITLLRVLTGNYWATNPNAPGSNPGTDHKDVCLTYAAPPESADFKLAVTYENEPRF